MKITQKIVFILLITISFSCKVTVEASKQKINKTIKQDDGKIDFTFLQLNDVYEISPIQGGKYGGMARVQTVHKQLLEENKNTLLFMAGDFLNPSLLGTLKYNGERIRGKQMIEVMNAMNFDLVAFGNHEFDLSKKDLQKRLNESNFEWVSANVRQKVNGGTYPFYSIRKGIKHFVHDTYIKELVDADGTRIKIGFISVCIDSNPKNYVQYNDRYAQAQRAYKAVKNKADVVIAFTHIKITHDKKIAKMIPSIPLIMGGHEHTNMLVLVGNTKISKADANAKTAYIHRFQYDVKTKKVTIKSELKIIDKKVKEDFVVKKIVDKWQAVLNAKINNLIKNPEEVIFTAKTPLEARNTPIRSVQTTMGNVITKAMSFAYNNKVDCALVNGGSIRIDDVLRGDISAVDIFRVLPYGGGILKVELKGSLLKKVLEFGKNATVTGAYLQRYNAKKENNIWKVKNLPIIDDKIYTVAFSDYLLKGYDIPFLKEKNKEVLKVYYPNKEMLAYDIRKAIIKYLKSL